MFNVTVLDGRKLIKYICLIIVIIIVFLLLKLMKNAKQQENVKQVLESATQEVYSHSYLNVMDTAIASMKYINSSKEKNDTPKKTFVSSILNSELGLNTKIIAKAIDEIIIKDEIETIDDKKEEINIEIPETIITQVIEDKNITPTYTNSYESVQIKNKSRI